MELDKIFGLPAHPLLVHIPVALIPLCAVGAIVMVASPSWRQRIGWVVVGLAGVAVIASQLAAGSGEAFEEALNEETPLIHRHAELGETFVWFAAAFFLAVLALMVWDTIQRRKGKEEKGDDGRSAATGRAIAMILSVIVVIAAVGVTYRVYQVGHSGAKAVWSQDAGAFGGSSGG